jgi:hypothetical protein
MAVGGATVPRAFLLPWGTALGSVAIPDAKCIVLQIFFEPYIFAKLKGKYKKEKNSNT